MKKTVRNFSLALMLLLSFNGIFTNAFAQAPNLISYQVVVRNAGNALLANLPVGMQVSILQGSASGTAVYVETQMPTTNINGLATIQIGGGTLVSGDFTTINWSAGPYFIKTETDPAGGTSYSIVATQQLLSVPYAIYAATSGSSTPGPAGNGIVSTVDNGNGTFTITYSDASTFTTANLTGPQGVAGNDGAIGPVGPQGPAGVLSVNCLQCHDHNSTTSSPLAEALENAAYEIEFSGHDQGAELAIGEGFSTTCAACHSNEGFHSVVDAAVVPTYNYNATSGTFSYSYAASAAASSAMQSMPGKISCFTCHKGAAVDSMKLYTTAPIPMALFPTVSSGTAPTLWAPKTINMTQANSQSNLCIKCHQPRNLNINTLGTLPNKNNGFSVDYYDLAANPTQVWYDSAVGNAYPNKYIPSSSSPFHYGPNGAIYSGQGGVQFGYSGTMSATSIHATDASCQSCHMAAPTEFTGGHSFNVAHYDTSAGGTSYSKIMNYKGCNVAGCHSTPMSNSNATLTAFKAEINAKLDSLYRILQSGNVSLLKKDPDYTTNKRYFATTTSGYNGSFNIYNTSGANLTGQFRNPAPGGTWTAAQIAANNALPKFPALTKGQMGAYINFCLVVKDYSCGLHNPEYVRALLRCSIQELLNEGFTYNSLVP
ncbi:MAG: hypothetical protein HY951_18110 [Bacteroidia bacterium]|nr:hypothetical protein [Bacteroidia bacterium]